MKQPLVWAVSLFLALMPDWAQSAAADEGFDPEFGGVSPHGLSATPPSVFDAIEKEDAEWIEDHMKSNPGDLEDAVCDERGPLRYAVSRQRPKSVKCLLILGADPNVPDRFEQTAIFSAIDKYNKAQGADREQIAELILKLLTFHPKTDLKKKSGMSSVEMYMPENMKNDYLAALALQSIRAFQSGAERDPLLAPPSPTNSVASSTGATMGTGRSIFKAIEEEDIEEIEDIVESDHDALETSQYEKKGPLLYAIIKQRLESVECLLSLGADPNVPDSLGQTAIFSAFDKYIKAQGTARGQKAELILKLLTFYPKTDLKKKSDMSSVVVFMSKNKKIDYLAALMLQSIYKAQEKEPESAGAASASSAAASPSETVSASLAAASAAAAASASSSAASVSSVEAQPAM